MRRTIVPALALIGLLAGGFAGQADDKKPPVKKAKTSKVSDVPSRALERVKRSTEIKMTRMTTAFDISDGDQEKVVVIVEMAGGFVGIYAGYADPAEDQWVILERDNKIILTEALGRN